MIKDFLRIITATLILPSYLLNANDEEINDEEVREVDEVIVEEQLEVEVEDDDEEIEDEQVEVQADEDESVSILESLTAGEIAAAIAALFGVSNALDDDCLLYTSPSPRD